jgi:PKD repeat protein
MIDFGDGATSTVECARWKPETDYCERMQSVQHTYLHPGTYEVRNPTTIEPPVEVVVLATIAESITDAERVAGYYYVDLEQKKAGTPGDWSVYKGGGRLMWYDPHKYGIDRINHFPPPDVSPLTGKAPLTVVMTPLLPGADDGPWSVSFGDGSAPISVRCAEDWTPETPMCKYMKKIEHTYANPGTYLVRELDRPPAQIVVQ